MLSIYDVVTESKAEKTITYKELVKANKRVDKDLANGKISIAEAKVAKKVNEKNFEAFKAQAEANVQAKTNPETTVAKETVETTMPKTENDKMVSEKNMNAKVSETDKFVPASYKNGKGIDSYSDHEVKKSTPSMTATVSPSKVARTWSLRKM